MFFDITIGGVAAGRVKMELFADVVPKTAGGTDCARCLRGEPDDGWRMMDETEMGW